MLPCSLARGLQPPLPPGKSLPGNQHSCPPLSGLQGRQKATLCVPRPHFWSGMDFSSTLCPGTSWVLTVWKSCLSPNNPNNTAFQIPSSLSKPLAVIRSSLVLSRGFYTAAGSWEMQWFSSAWPSSRGSLPSPPAPPAAWLPLLDTLGCGEDAEAGTAVWLLHQAGFWDLIDGFAGCLKLPTVLCENCPPGKSNFNFPQSWEVTAQELLADSGAFCASSDASWEWRG